MNWGSFDAFLAMGGYGLYVWGSYGACAIAVVAELVQLRARRREALRGVAMRARTRQQGVNDETTA